MFAKPIVSSILTLSGIILYSSTLLLLDGSNIDVGNPEHIAVAIAMTLPVIILAGIVGLVATLIGYLLLSQRTVGALFFLFSIFFLGTTMFASYGLTTIRNANSIEQGDKHTVGQEVAIPEEAVNKNAQPPSYFLKKELKETSAGN